MLFVVLLVCSVLLASCKGSSKEDASAAQTASNATTQTQTAATTTATVAPAATPAPALTAAAAVATTEGSTLKTVLDRGYLIAGVNSANAGFSYLESDGTYKGFEADIARAIATAIFGDPSKIEFRPLTSKERFVALQNGEIDLLVRTATITETRDTELGLDFTVPYFYDGQTFLVRKDSGIKTPEDLAGATIAVLTGSTSESNLSDYMAAKGITYKPLLFESLDELKNAFFSGRADAWTGDKSSIAATAATYPNASDYVTLDTTISKEPLGIAVREGDSKWKDICQWTLFALFFGDEHNITSANVDQIKATTKTPEVQTVLGTRGNSGKQLGLSPDWAYNVIKTMGNYKEIFDRHLGPGTIFNVARGLNRPWTEGGLNYSYPFR